ncbi:MAG: TatD family hydrolase [Nanoarchaeota archaeon]|nr:TatD family hydrolase [Nanoarchaeota archaeon]MBU1029670.1 TatD family hydrolase [Nanoarchaeota archaeon]MBU1849388.1 TatD family hydrolase [Nanoarchaeota archaeon]
MILIDVHAHLDFPEFEKDIEQVVRNSEKTNVKVIICNGINPKSNRDILSLSKKFDIIKPALGFYPCECDLISPEEFDEELLFIKKNKPFAIGEVGLDKKHNNDFQKQIICFEKFIKLSKKLNIPIIVHSRKAEIEAIEILEKHKLAKVVMHCFSGKKKLLQRIINNKWYLSIPCNVVRSEQFQEAVKLCPLKQLLTETDAPFLSPNPKISRNEPKYVIETIKKISEIKNMDAEEVANIIFMNYQNLFL